MNDLLDGQFQNFCRMPFKDFEYLLSLTEPAIRKQDTNYRDAISPKERLVITLRFLATGDSFSSLMYNFEVSKSSVSRIVHDVFRTLSDALKQYVHVSKSYEFSFFVEDQFGGCGFIGQEINLAECRFGRGKKLGHKNIHK